MYPLRMVYAAVAAGSLLGAATFAVVHTHHDPAPPSEPVTFTTLPFEIEGDYVGTCSVTVTADGPMDISCDFDEPVYYTPAEP